jgi:hypothetical protein
VVNQQKVNLELGLYAEARISANNLNEIKCQGVLVNKSSQSFYIPRLLKEDRPYFLLWSIKRSQTNWIGNAAPEIETYGYGLSEENIQLMEDSSKMEFSFEINLEQEFGKRDIILEKGTYTVKILIENYYLNAKTKTYPMWFGKVESNQENIEVY